MNRSTINIGVSKVTPWKEKLKEPLGSPQHSISLSNLELTVF